MKWISLKTPPKASGTYIVGHRGHKIISHYMTGSKSRNVKLGWHDDPRDFGATHWAEIESIEDSTEKREFIRPVSKKTIVTFTLSVTNAPFVIGEHRNVYPGKHLWSKSIVKTRPRTDIGEIKKGMTGTVLDSFYTDGFTVKQLQFDIELHDGKGSLVTFTNSSGFPFTCDAFLGDMI